VSFASLAQPSIEPLIDRFAEASDVTLLVGAGASMEADLPSWAELVEKLLMTVAESRAELSTPETKAQWVEQTLERDDLLGAGAVVEVMANTSLDELVPEKLYGPGGPADVAPGEIAGQVAYLRSCFGSDLEILTTNYDDLIEEALVATGLPRSGVKSYVTNRSPDKRKPDAVGVVHLHGLAGRTGEPTRIVLTEEHYHRMQRGSSWQERLVTQRLERSICLFVGMSLADPNLIRYLYGYKQSQARKHAAIFVRQGEPACPDDVRAIREEATQRRWGRCGVEAIFVDHFADAAQLLYEIGYRKKVGPAYEPVGVRAGRLIERTERALLFADRPAAEFAGRQVALSRLLRELLGDVLDLALAGEQAPDDEKLALALWLTDTAGKELTGWAHSDRAHQDPATIFPVEITANSEWVSIQTICRGMRTELDRNTYASRWRFVRGLPLIMNEPSRLAIGCLTISSNKPAAESVLAQMSPDRRAAVHLALIETIRGVVSHFAESDGPSVPDAS
jgi:hypothetical protein